MVRLKWWLRIVGVFHVLQFVMNSLFHAPLVPLVQQTRWPGLLPEVLWRDSCRHLGDIRLGGRRHWCGATHSFSVPDQAKLLVWTIIGIELARGIVNDLYMIPHRLPRKATNASA